MIQNQITKTSQINLQKYLNYFFIAYTFSFPLSKGATSILSGLILLTWIFDGHFKDKFEILKNNLLVQSLTLLIVFSLISILWSSDSSLAFNYIHKYWHFLIIPIIIVSFEKKYLKILLLAFVSSMIISSFISFGVILNILKFSTTSIDNPNPFMDHSSSSIFLAFSVFCIFYLLKIEENIKIKIFYFASLLIVIIALILSGGRVGQVSFLIVLLVFSIYYSKDKLKNFSLMVISLSIILISLFNISSNFNNRFGQLIDDTFKLFLYNDYSGGGLGARVSLWIIGLDKFSENPIIGSGIGNEGIGAKNYAKIHNFSYWEETLDETKVDYHNTFIQYSTQLGIVGLFLILLVFYSLIILKIKDRNIKQLSLAFIILFFLLSLFGNTFHLRNSMVFFVIFSSIFATIARIEQEEQNKNS